MKKRIPDWMKREHEKLKEKWEKSGSEEDFYKWAVERFETEMQKALDVPFRRNHLA